MVPPLRLLHLEDNELDAELVQDRLELDGVKCEIDVAATVRTKIGDEGPHPESSTPATPTPLAKTLRLTQPAVSSSPAPSCPNNVRTISMNGIR